MIGLRTAADGDMATIQAIYAHHVLHGLASFEEMPPSIEDMRVRREAIVAQGMPYLVAEIGGTIVGYAYVGPYRTRSAYRFTVEDSIYIAPGQQNRGIGSRLLQALIECCERGPWRRMIAVIGDSDNEASIALHRRCGFERVGILPAVGFKFGRWVDSVLWQRALGDGANNIPDECRTSE